MTVSVSHFEAFAPGDPFPRHRVHVSSEAGRTDALLVCPIALFEVGGRLNILAAAWPWLSAGPIPALDLRMSATAGGSPLVHMGVGSLEPDLVAALLGQRWPRAPHRSRALLYSLRRLVTGSQRSEADLALGRAISVRGRV